MCTNEVSSIDFSGLFVEKTSGQSSDRQISENIISLILSKNKIKKNSF